MSNFIVVTLIVTEIYSLGFCNVGASCILTSQTFTQEQASFTNLSASGAKIIYFSFNITSLHVNVGTELYKYFLKNSEFVWVNVSNRHFLSYPEDVNIFSFGLMRAGMHKVDIDIIIDNVTECKNETEINLFRYLNVLVYSNATDYSLCYPYTQDQYWKGFFSNITGVFVGYDFMCFENGDEKSIIRLRKSPVNYIIMAIIISLYCFYPLILSLSFHKDEIDKTSQRYYRSESPYNPIKLLINFFFKGASLNICAFRISLFIFVFFLLGSFLKVIMIQKCNCFFKLKNHFPNHYSGEVNDFLIYAFFSALYFFFYNMFIIFHAENSVNTFILFDILYIFKGYSFFRWIPLSVFQEKVTNEKSITPYVYSKFALIISLRFWTKIFFMPFGNIRRPMSVTLYIGVFVLCVTIFPFNVFLICVFTLCPFFSCLYFLFFWKFYLFYVMKKQGCLLSFIIQMFIYLLSFSFPFVVLLLFTQGDVLFYGISNIIQYISFTAFIAVPNLKSNDFIVFLVCFACVSYILTYIKHFLDFYRDLLEVVLEMKSEALYISVKEFDSLVATFFPFTGGFFFLIIKIIMTVLFFTIVLLIMNDFENEQDLNLLDLDTFISVLFLIAPPKLLELFFFNDSKRRIEYKHDEIKKFLSTYQPTSQESNPKKSKSSRRHKIQNFITFFYIPNVISKDENKDIIAYACCKERCECCRKKDFSRTLRCCFSLCCGCYNCPVDTKTGNCICCINVIEDKTLYKKDDRETATVQFINRYTVINIPLSSKKSKKQDADDSSKKSKKHDADGPMHACTTVSPAKNDI